MKYLLIAGITATISIIACQQAPKPAEVKDEGPQYYGEKIDEENVMDINKLTMQMEGKDNVNAKVKGEVDKVCQKKGCWMTMKKEDGESMRVTFKDYGFFVPKDISGKVVVIEGKAMRDTTSVEMLRHYAEDEGASVEEIEQITDPEIEIVFEAEGVIVM